MKISSLRQARKNLALSLQDTAQILGVDASNLSKYEYGKGHAASRLIIGYHLITRAPLKNLFRQHIAGIRATLIERTETLITKIRGEPPTPKQMHRLEALSFVLANLSSNDDEYGTET